MEKTRKFYIINAKGQSCDLNVAGSFFHSPKGLGYDSKITSVQVGNSFLVESRELKQKKISGKIAFHTYVQFNEFANFIQYAPLTFVYETAAGIWNIDGYVQTITKEEKENGILSAGITFLCTSSWYRLTQYKNEQKLNVGKVYNAEGYYSYPFEYVDNTAGTIAFKCAGVIESPCKIIIIGPCTKPMWQHSINGKTVAKGKMMMDIPEGNRLIISSRPEDRYIKEYNESGELVGDRYTYSDFSTYRFLTAQDGDNVISFGHEGAETIKIYVEVEERYEAV